MSASTAPSTTRTTSFESTPKRTALVLAVVHSAIFVGIFFFGGYEIAQDASGKEVIDEFTMSSVHVQLGGYALVVAAILLVFWGAAIRSLLTANRRSWTADVVLAGSLSMALAIVGWTVTLFALEFAVESGVPEVAEAINILDNANFVPAMLGLACLMVGVGLTALREGSLPKWFAIASVVLGALAPLGPGGFAPFTLFPLWIIAVSALVRVPTER